MYPILCEDGKVYYGLTGASGRLCFDFPHRRSITLLAKQ